MDKKKRIKNLLFIFMTVAMAIFSLHLFLWINFSVLSRDGNGLTLKQIIGKNVESDQRYKNFTDARVDYAELEKQIKTGHSKSRRVFCIGDSWTYGMMVGEGEKYPSRLQKYLPGYKIINLGKPGMTSSDAVKIADQFSDYFQKGDIVVMLVGQSDLASDFFSWRREKYASHKNESFFSPYPWEAAFKLITVAVRNRFNEIKFKKDKFQKNVEVIISRVREKGAKPLLLTYSLAHNTPSRVFDPNDQTSREYLIMDDIKEAGKKLGVATIDFEAILQTKEDKNSYFLDVYFCHMNPKGYDLIAEYVAREIQMMEGRNVSNQ